MSIVAVTVSLSTVAVACPVPPAPPAVDIVVAAPSVGPVVAEIVPLVGDTLPRNAPPNVTGSPPRRARLSPTSLPKELVRKLAVSCVLVFAQIVGESGVKRSIRNGLYQAGFMSEG